MDARNTSKWGERGIQDQEKEIAGIALREENNVIGVFDTVKSVHVK